MTFGPKVRTLFEALMSKTRIISTFDFGGCVRSPFLRQWTSLDAGGHAGFVVPLIVSGHFIRKQGPAGLWKFQSGPIMNEQVFALLGCGEQFGCQGGHGAVLGADVGADLDGQLVSLGDGLAVEDGGAEGACERVTGADGVGHFNLRCLLERHLSTCEDEPLVPQVSTSISRLYLPRMSQHLFSMSRPG